MGVECNSGILINVSFTVSSLLAKQEQNFVYEAIMCCVRA